MHVQQILYSKVNNEEHLKVLRHYGTLQKSFHQVRDGSRAVHDGSRTVHEPVLCIGINRYKRSFECYAQLCEQVHKVL